MHITVFCPHCQSRYQVDPSLLGKRMRCPNTICRAVFEVRHQAAVAAPSFPRPASLEANVDSFAAELGIPPDDEVAAPGKVSEKAPVELQPGTWQPPPVRGAGNSVTAEELVNVAPAQAILPEPPPTLAKPHSRRHSLILIVTMLAILAGASAVGIYLVGGKAALAEAERLQKAQALYQNQDFAEARTAFQQLLRDYPDSKDRRHYDFLVELSAVREAVYASREQSAELAAALPSILQFLEIYQNDPLLKEYHGDIWYTLQRLAHSLTNLSEEQQNARYLEQAKRSWLEAGKFTPPTSAKANEIAQALQADFARVDGLLAARAARLELLEDLGALVARASADAVREGRIRAKNAGLDHDPELARLLDDLVQAHRAHVIFTPAARTVGAKLMPLALEDDLPGYYMTPRIGKVYPRSDEVAAPHVVFALARGVLYALDAASGDVLWLRRVGADTNALPLRVPRSLFAPDLALVISSDYKTVAGVAAVTGVEVWRHALEGVCVGQPVLVDRHLLVPTLSGRVEEIETTGGFFQGFYALGQPLALGGVRQPGTSLVYFPADSYSVYVLDVAKRTCAAVLYSDHAAGSLRGLPLVWNEARAPKESGGGWLLLDVASGSDGIQMRPYRLPIREPDQKPGKQINVRGDSWMAPWHDSEKLALATDAGMLALYGIRQPGDRDPLLFPLLKGDYRLEGDAGAVRPRALVVHADADNYWVLAAGKLQRLQATFTAAAGPGLLARWPQPVDVGSPLHAGQVHIGADGATSFILVTQNQDTPTCWVRAIDADQGQILWQRQLGMVCQDEPVAGSDAVLSTASNGTFLFDARQFSTEKRWQAAPTFIEADGKRTNHWACALGAGFVQLAWGLDTDLRITVFDGKGVVAHKDYPLPAPPQGTPALGSNFVLLPLANNVVLRVPLPPDEGGVTSGPDWRGPGVDESQPGHIVALGNNEFAITDGGRSLWRLRWDDNKPWEKIGSAELPRRITAAPAVVGRRLLVADAADTVSVVDGDQVVPGRWSPAGKITAGPFVRGQGVGLVVNHNRLVWLDPNKEQPVWEYTFVAPIVGQPELVEGLLVVADLQGGIVGLDPTTGNPAGPGYHLKANEAPTATPLPFGADRFFMPLMDGTVMVLPIAKLRH